MHSTRLPLRHRFALFVSPVLVVGPITVVASRFAYWGPAVLWILSMIGFGTISMVTGTSVAENHPWTAMTPDDQAEDMRPLDNFGGARVDYLGLGLAVWALVAFLFVMT